MEIGLIIALILLCIGGCIIFIIPIYFLSKLMYIIGKSIINDKGDDENESI